MEKKATHAGCLLSFVVVGDIHFYGQPPCGGISDTPPDSRRYLWTTENVVPEIRRLIKELKPDFVMCTGDPVEGLKSNPLKDRKKESGLFFKNFVSRLNIPFFTVLGTHEGREFSRRYFLPYLDVPSNNFYYVIAKGKFRFIFLDAFVFDGKQEKWLKNEMKKIPEDAFVFIFSHCPVFSIARPFFVSPVFQEKLRGILASYKTDAFFCGHTHNQSVTLHRLGENSAFQVKASSVGYPSAPVCRLEKRAHVFIEGGKNRYFWGVPEDNSPGLWHVKAYGDRIEYRWFALGRGMQSFFVQDRKNGSYTMKKLPGFEPEIEVRFSDLYQVRNAFLSIMGLGVNEENIKIFLNGKFIGWCPLNGCWAARREITLLKGDLRLLKKRNTVKAVLPEGVKHTALGNVQLRFEFYHREEGYSQLGRFIYSTQDLLDESPLLKNGFMRAVKGNEITWTISFR